MKFSMANSEKTFHFIRCLKVISSFFEFSKGFSLFLITLMSSKANNRLRLPKIIEVNFGCQRVGFDG